MKSFLSIFLLGSIFLSSLGTGLVKAADRNELQSQIDLKKQELDRINRELETTKVNLEGVQKQRQALQREIGTLENSMKQLDLSIRSDEVTIDKLALEIESLNFDLDDIERSSESKEKGIEDIFRELQRGEGDNLLIFFLRHDSLEAALSEVQSLTSLKLQLMKEIGDLAELHEKQTAALDDVQVKRGSLEVHKKNLKNRKLIVEDQKQTRQTILEQTKNQESVFESKVNDLKKQQDAMADEIQKIEDQLRKSFNVSLLPVKNHNVFNWPVLGGAGRITQHFGEISSLYRGKPHNGLDVGIPIGTPIVAAADGVVMAVDNNDVSRTRKYQYGKYVLLKHDNSLATIYAHLSQQIVFTGQSVKRGDIIGYSGSTGYATGPHLHFGAYWAPSIQFKPVPPAAGLVPIGVAVDPEGYL